VDAQPPIPQSPWIRRQSGQGPSVTRAAALPVSDSEDESVQLTKSLEHESDHLWKHNRLVAIITLTLPIWTSTAILAAAIVWGGAALVRKLIVATVASFVAGRLIILGGDSAGHSTGFSSFQLALLVLYLDVMWAVVLTWHAGALFHVPWLGNRLKSAVQEGSSLVGQHRWMRNATFAAVLCFVMLPISSTGSIGGSLLGRLLGLSKRATLTLVLTGSVLGCTAMYAGAEMLEQYIDNSHSAVRYGGIAVLVFLFFVLGRRYRRSIAPNDTV
jgi:uncharacterized membrane protein